MLLILPDRVVADVPQPMLLAQPAALSATRCRSKAGGAVPCIVGLLDG